MHLIEKAKEKVKEINQTTLFQKAEIKKNFIKRIEADSLKIKNHFFESYNQFLNNSLTELLTKTKDEVLFLKNRLLEILRNGLKQNIRSKISENYANYIKYFMDTVKTVNFEIDKPPTVFTILNSKDYNYFKTNFKKLQDLFKNKIEIIKSDDEFIGGFKVMSIDKNVLYDFSIDYQLTKNSTLIEQEFLIVFSESEIKKLRLNYEKFIQKKRIEIKEYIKEYV